MNLSDFMCCRAGRFHIASQDYYPAIFICHSNISIVINTWVVTNETKECITKSKPWNIYTWRIFIYYIEVSVVYYVHSANKYCNMQYIAYLIELMMIDIVCKDELCEMCT